MTKTIKTNLLEVSSYIGKLSKNTHLLTKVYTWDLTQITTNGCFTDTLHENIYFISHHKHPIWIFLSIIKQPSNSMDKFRLLEYSGIYIFNVQTLIKKNLKYKIKV